MKISVRRKSENFSPDGKEPIILTVNSIDEALHEVWEQTQDSDIRVSSNSGNSSIVGLGVDFDFEIQDEKEDEY
ncbi:MAG TPA: hypothetical protein VL854_06795 [Nitrososphaeraceae archaeon]|nr:hypothetical protein [Nitrososphaeraceae archaeon]